MIPNVITRPVRYHEDASALFQHLDHGNDVVLLESADITSKEGLSSIAVLQASARVTCKGQRVSIEPLTQSGLLIRQRICNQLGQDLVFPVSNAPNEWDRLTALSSIEVLRKLQMDPGYEIEGWPFLAGGFAFDYLDSFEELPAVLDSVNSFPDYEFLVAEVLLVIDHQAKTAEIQALSLDPDQDLSPVIEDFAKRIDAPLPKRTVSRETPKLTATADISDAEFREQVIQLQENIRNGDIYQVVPARTFTIPCNDAFAAYRILRETNPSPYMFYVRSGGSELFGASPESSLKFTAATRQVELYPIAGTRPRGSTHELDIRNELELRTDAKEISEHTMLVDLARNDVARVAVPGTRQVAELMKVDRYSRVMHLVSRVIATLHPELDALDAYRACMNMGTLTGAPKLRATELLRGVEKHRRGSYGGAVGYLRGGGDMDTCIVIRSAYVHNGMAAVQAGAGVVRDSDPQAEADETLHKAYAVLHAIAAAVGAEVEVKR
ncbi:anthranilate synthase component 1 [Corynebacterium freiburgense]|uniref:anthranilate synthase component 1 n=1 Tax=Corynebacterium freiburgense TaxID=556548 RepID=UPI000417F3D5|nr:anthranilate synthase component 1 [Corynebacterium freiburgense]WJZ03959.1 Anthranilate synthase component 1 [Corynebacterium freiburgense]